MIKIKINYIIDLSKIFLIFSFQGSNAESKLDSDGKLLKIKLKGKKYMLISKNLHSFPLSMKLSQKNLFVSLNDENYLCQVLRCSCWDLGY